jgi:N utilization substance protein B
MPGVDRNIARIAVYEMKFGAERLPPNVAINEAVELAKVFGTEDSSRFINGILGSLAKSRG